MQKLRIHPEKKYLMNEDGTPFFYLADTAWELFHRLSREDADYYLRTRAEQGFNTIQAVLLAEFDGLTKPNSYGRYPLLQKDGVYDPTMPDVGGEYDYWQHVDYIVGKAAELGLYIAMLPTWGDKYNMKWGKGPEIFTPENAAIYASFVAKRYWTFDNIIWVLGGDRPLETQTHKAIIDAMGETIRKEDPSALITYHPMGCHSSAEYVADCDYIDFHSVQSGHGTEAFDCIELLQYTKKSENKPFFDMEPRYEDHPACFKAQYGYYWDASDVRQNAYWELMEGVCGYTYGNHCIWSMNTEKTDYYPYIWKDALVHEGANQIQYLKKLRMSRPFFELRPAPEILENESAVNAKQAAARGEAYAFAYTPLGLPIRVYLDKLTDKRVKVSWFDPRLGSVNVFGVVPPKECLFVPPTSGKGNDWVLIMDIMD